MNDTRTDPRAAELLRRRAEKAATVTATSPAGPAEDPPGRKLGDESKAEIRRLAEANPRWKTGDLAGAYESEHGWRPTPQAIGRALSDPATSGPKTRRPATRRPAAPDPAGEVQAIAAVSMALSPLYSGEVRRVLAWARDRFENGGEA